MKVLHLIRHAKSDHPTPPVPDIERRLNDRGRHDATAMGKRFVASNNLPRVLYTSPAERAKLTSELFINGTGAKDVDVRIEPDLYGAGTQGIIGVVQSIPDAIDSAAVVCHNPDITEAANRLGTLAIENMPTCSVVTIRFETSKWADVEHVERKTLSYDFPKRKS